MVQTPNSQSGWPTPPELPPLGSPELYISYPDVMPLETRKRYVKDRTQMGVAYIVEHSHTTTLKGENRYHTGMLDTRLSIIFGRAQAIREKIDEAIGMDDMYRRRRNMRTLMAPTRFPDPANMNRTSNDEWLRWMRQEMFELVEAIDGEKRARQDENDPFNGTAGGVFRPLPELNRENSWRLGATNPGGIANQTPQPPTENDQGISPQHPDQGEMAPQNNDQQTETPERVIPIQTIRPTPQVQRVTRRNATETGQQQPVPITGTTPANRQVQTPLDASNNNGGGYSRRNISRYKKKQTSGRRNFVKGGDTTQDKPYKEGCHKPGTRKRA